MSLNLDWINNLIKQIPKTKSYRKNLIEIAGYPKWETVNSNLLAFYLDENEEHGFGRLFFDSLLDLYRQKTGNNIAIELNDSNFIVEREVATLNGGRIDIVITCESEEAEENQTPDWAVIVENKLFADLYNNLFDYWSSINVENKIGIVLTVNPVQINRELLDQGIVFVNILHKDLIDKIKQNLANYYLDSDDRHLLFLKEYISNINSFYKDKSNMQNLDKALELFHLKSEEIAELKRVDLNLLKHVSNSLFTIMEENGFPPDSLKDTSKSKHFYIFRESDKLSKVIKDNIDYASKFRFWVNIGDLRYNNRITGVFELYGIENTKYGDKLKDRLNHLGITSDNVTIGTGGKSGAGYQHIYHFNIAIDDFKDNGFKAQLKKVMEKEIFEHENEFIDKAVIELKKIIDNE